MGLKEPQRYPSLLLSPILAVDQALCTLIEQSLSVSNLTQAEICGTETVYGRGV